MREGTADRGEEFGSSGMQWVVVAVWIAAGRDMIVVRIDCRSAYVRAAK